MAVPDFSIVDSTQWSAVADLIEEVQDRIPEEKIPMIFPVLNRAVRTIAKRLLVLQSDLIIGSLSVPIYAEDTYTADTIAFVTGTPPTITDSDSKFIATGGLTADRYITTDSDNNPGPFRIVTCAAGTLTLDQTDSVTTEAAGDDVTITSVDDYAPLPNDFWGLAGKPYMSGNTWPLLPSPNMDTELQYTSAGEPMYYRLKGSLLWVYPATASDYTICGDYYRKPAKISQMQDKIPFDQLLDDVIQEYLVEAINGGSAAASSRLTQFLVEQTDLIAALRGKAAPAEMPDGINYSVLME